MFSNGFVIAMRRMIKRSKNSTSLEGHPSQGPRDNEYGGRGIIGRLKFGLENKDYNQENRQKAANARESFETITGRPPDWARDAANGNALGRRKQKLGGVLA